MDEDKLTPEIEKLLKQVKLKEPPQELMKDYLGGVHNKINQQSGTPHFGFPQVSLVLAVGLVFAGVFYFMSARSVNHQAGYELPPVLVQAPEQTTPEMAAPSTEVSLPEVQLSVSNQGTELSLEEESTLLETLESGFSDEEDEVLGDEDLFEELALLDELEISNAAASVPGV